MNTNRKQTALGVSLCRSGGILAITLLLLAHASWGQPGKPRVLFHEIPATALSGQQHSILANIQRQATTVRTGIVGIDVDRLLQDQIVTFNLFPLKEFDVAIDHIETRSPHDMTWIGTTVDVPGSAIIVIQDDIIVGTIRIDGEVYSIRSLRNGRYAIVQEDQSKYPEEEPKGFRDMQRREDYWKSKVDDAKKQNREAAGAAGTLLRVLVAYTQSAENAVIASGSTMAAHIQLAINESNQAYTNSQVTPKLRLAYKYKVTYTEAGYGTDLERFKGTGDGYMDEVHTYRNEYTADLCLLIFNDASLCGVAYTIMADASTAFCLVHWSCATGYFSFAHELGHLQGARHNPEVDPTNTPFAYGHGYVHCTTPLFRTIMAYNNAPCDVPRVQYISNPNVTYGGAATGTAATHDNHRVLNETAVTVDGFQPDDLVLSSGSITTAKTYEAENTITAQTAYTVQSGGNVTFKASGSIDLKPGFKASSGSAFDAKVDASLGLPGRTIVADPNGSPESGLPDLSSKTKLGTPAEFSLKPNYPNPFNPSTIIQYDLPQDGNVVLSVFNTLGQEVMTLVNEFEAAGYKTVEFTPGNLPSGVYFYRLQAGGFTEIKKMLLMK